MRDVCGAAGVGRRGRRSVLQWAPEAAAGQGEFLWCHSSLSACQGELFCTSLSAGGTRLGEGDWQAIQCFSGRGDWGAEGERHVFSLLEEASNAV